MTVASPVSLTPVDADRAFPQLERLVGAFLEREEPLAFNNAMFHFGG